MFYCPLTDLKIYRNAIYCRVLAQPNIFGLLTGKEPRTTARPQLPAQTASRVQPLRSSVSVEQQTRMPRNHQILVGRHHPDGYR